ncbi:hypothetical protein P3X46_016421 [Hevea brasiliensis]|uniref:CASP-like protein n=1 Tax=Hevea brasiliensis TaxID=3981 RepID=A0ABQ9M169_HEVBR|nr:hypothetical protein P3X46_016421 [Hevea brasiliensis]
MEMEGQAEGSISNPRHGVSIIDFILSVVAVVGTLGSAILMAATHEILPFSTEFVRLGAEYDDLPTFTCVFCGRQFHCKRLSAPLPLSIFNIVRSNAKYNRNIFIIFDSAIMALLSAGASAAAAAIVYLAHKGNVRANWFDICQQFNSFCEHIYSSLIGSFIGIAAFILLILLSTVVLCQ